MVVYLNNKILSINGVYIDVSKYKNLRIDKFDFKSIEEKPLEEPLKGPLEPLNTEGEEIKSETSFRV